MQIKHFIVYVSVMTILLQAVQGRQCDPTSGCNEHSHCDVISGYCSCLSGFSGENCTVQPQPSCSSSYNKPSADSSFDFGSEYSFTLNTLKIQLNASLENNRHVDSSATPLVDDLNSAHSLSTAITWSGSSTNCNYPASTSVWSKAAVIPGACLDSYTLHMNWNDVKSACGFTYDSSNKVWSNSVTITRYYAIPFNATIIGEQKREGHAFVRAESATSVITITSEEIIVEEVVESPAEATDSNSDSNVASNSDSNAASNSDSTAVSDTESTSAETNSNYLPTDTEIDTAASDTIEPNNAVDAEIAPSSSYTDRHGFSVKNWQIAMAAIAGGFGVCFVITITAIVLVRRRNARKAQAEFNFAGIDSN